MMKTREQVMSEQQALYDTLTETFRQVQFLKCNYLDKYIGGIMLTAYEFDLLTLNTAVCPTYSAAAARDTRPERMLLTEYVGPLAGYIVADATRTCSFSGEIWGIPIFVYPIREFPQGLPSRIIYAKPN